MAVCMIYHLCILLYSYKICLVRTVFKYVVLLKTVNIFSMLTYTAWYFNK